MLSGDCPPCLLMAETAACQGSTEFKATSERDNALEKRLEMLEMLLKSTGYSVEPLETDLPLLDDSPLFRK